MSRDFPDSLDLRPSQASFLPLSLASRLLQASSAPLVVPGPLILAAVRGGTDHSRPAERPWGPMRTDCLRRSPPWSSIPPPPVVISAPLAVALRPARRGTGWKYGHRGSCSRPDQGRGRPTHPPRWQGSALAPKAKPQDHQACFRHHASLLSLPESRFKSSCDAVEPQGPPRRRRALLIASGGAFRSLSFSIRLLRPLSLLPPLKRTCHAHGAGAEGATLRKKPPCPPQMGTPVQCQEQPTDLLSDGNSADAALSKSAFGPRGASSWRKLQPARGAKLLA